MAAPWLPDEPSGTRMCENALAVPLIPPNGGYVVGLFWSQKQIIYIKMFTLLMFHDWKCPLRPNS